MEDYILSKDAMRDMEDIDEYGFLRFGVEKTDAYIAHLKTVLLLLASHPDMGRVDTRFTPPIHRFEHYSHIILYDAYKDHIFITRILHKAVDIDTHIDMER